MSMFVHIVDDDDGLRASLFSLLSIRHDLLVDGFRSGDEFVQALAGLEPGIVLLDIHMPGLSGIDVLRRLGKEPRGFCTIVITGQSDIAIAVQAMKLGAFDFIEKPYDRQTLFRSIDAAIARLHRDGRAAERTQEAKARIAALSDREQEVLMQLIEGRPNKAIAQLLDVSPRTVEVHRANLMVKLGVGNLPEALRLAYAAGLIPES